jgi:hypothetical protein
MARAIFLEHIACAVITHAVGDYRFPYHADKILSQNTI